MDYDYQQVSGGYRWNMLQRIFNEVGIEPIGSGDVDDRTVLTFSRPLTDTEKQKLDTLMASNPTFPPSTGGTIFVVRDVWNQKTLIEDAMGATYKLYYSESVIGSGDIDQVELHFDQVLTSTQCDKVISEYGKLISLK